MRPGGKIIDLFKEPATGYCTPGNAPAILNDIGRKYGGIRSTLKGMRF